MDNTETADGSSPLAILNQAPRVQIEQPPPQPTQYARKPGIVRGVIGAIPFIGPKLAGTDKKPRIAPVLTPRPAEEPVETPSGRAPMLYPPPAESDNGDSGTTHTQIAAPATGGVIIGARSTPNAEPGDGFSPRGRPIEVKVGEPKPASAQGLLIGHGETISVKPESTHAPEVSGDENSAPTDSQAEVASKSPVPSVPREATARIVAESRQSSPTLEATDLAMPNPKVEENVVIRGEFEAAVREGRAGNFTLAAQHFREYGDNHPSSGLAPRALFLAAVLEADSSRAEEATQALQKAHPDSKYIDELIRRKPADDVAMSGDLQTDAQKIEQKIENAPDDKSVQIGLRKKLAAIYLKLDQPDRALEALKTANGIAEGTSEEGEILALTAEAMIAGKDTAAAGETLNDLVQRFPLVAQRPRVRLNIGLVNEEGGYYQRAAATYRALVQDSPDSPEAKIAQARLKDMNKLSE